jgi:iron complex transport system ATP-binding protein
VLALIRDLAGRGLSVLMTSHFPDHAYWIADQAAVLHEGRLSHPSAPELVLSPEKLNQIYGVKVRLIKQNGQTICAPILPPSALRA